MPVNIPSGTEQNVSFGPAVVYLSPWAATITTPSLDANSDVGWIGDDGVSVELTSEKKNISQGNPSIPTYSFVTAQSAVVKFTSIQWDFANMRMALGAGTTDGTAGASGTTSTFSFGGNPLNQTSAMVVEHYMSVTGDTLSLFVWKCQSESGYTIPFGTDEHSFEFSFNAIQATHEWGSTSAELQFDEQLIRFNRAWTSRTTPPV